MKIYQKQTPRRSLPSQESLGSLTTEDTKRIVTGIYALGDRSTVAKRNEIPRVMPFLDLNFPARRRLSGNGKGVPS